MTDKIDDGAPVGPLGSPYPRPPWTHVGASSMTVYCRVDNPEPLRRAVPDVFTLTDPTIFGAFFLHIPCIAELSHNYQSHESGLFVPVEHRDSGRRGSTWIAMYVDTDVALVAGREIWGHPKRLGAVTVDLEPARGVGSVHLPPYHDHSNALVYEASAEFDGSCDDVLELDRRVAPRLQQRLIPSPFGPGWDFRDVVRVIVSDTTLHELRTGQGVLQLGEVADGLPDLGEVTTVGAVFKRSDFVLRYAKLATPREER